MGASAVVGMRAWPQDEQTVVPGASELPQWLQNIASTSERVYCSTGHGGKSSRVGMVAGWALIRDSSVLATGSTVNTSECDNDMLKRERREDS